MLGDCAKSRWVHWLLILAIFVPALAATLPVMQFTDSMESFNVLTAVEIARDGCWTLPTLWGRPRLEKPPLVQWLTAAGILGGGPLEFSTRWITVVVSCLTLVVIYEWTRLFSSVKTALVAALVGGTMIAFLRYGRRASYDSHLMFWVALTNYGLSWLVLRGRMLPAIIIGGVGLGGALMSKGPPALIQTLVPTGLFVAAFAFKRRRLTQSPVGMALQDDSMREASSPPLIEYGGVESIAYTPVKWKLLGKTAIVLGAVSLIGFAMVAPWVAAAVHEAGGIAATLDMWGGEVVREQERHHGMTSSPLEGVAYLAMLAPWTLWFMGAFIQGWRERGREGLHWAFLLTLAVVPVAIHSFIPPMQDRYLVPMLPPAAIACAMVLAIWLERVRTGTMRRLDHLAYAVHVVIVLAFVAGYPLFYAFSKTDTIPLGVAALLGASGIGIMAIAVAYRRRVPEILVVATVLAMLQSQAVFAWHQNRVPRPLEVAARQIAGDPQITQIAGYDNNIPPRAFAIYSGKRFVLVRGAGEIPADHALLTENDPPQGWSLVLEFVDGRHTWRLWQMAAPVSTIPRTYGK